MHFGGSAVRKIIEDLFYGNIDPISRSGYNDPELRNMEASLCLKAEEIENSLCGEEKKRVLNLIKEYSEYVNALQKQSFCDGFSLGVRIASEALIAAETLTLK